MKTRIIILFFLSLFLAALLSCKNPLKDEKKKELVIEKIFYSAPMGRHIYYWDGKDKNEKYVSPGKYIVVMEVKQFQDQDTFVAQPDGKTRKNDDGVYYYNEIWNDYELLHPEPDPFKIKEGVRISFLVSEPANVKISIFKN